MTVAELIAELQDCSPTATVLVDLDIDQVEILEVDFDEDVVFLIVC